MCCISLEPDNKETILMYTPEQWLKSDTVIKAKEKFANNEWPDACYKCKLQEENNVRSMRQKPRKYGPGLSHIDLRFGNSCNLGCVMCTPTSSSTIALEHQKLKTIGISPWGTENYDIFNWYTEELGDMFANLKDLREVYLTGGEPMMVKHLHSFLQKLDSSVELRFNTNGTLLNPLVLKELKRFEHVNMCYSLDGVGKVNEYIRWGSKWSEIENNMNVMSELSNVKMTVGPTIQVLNAYYYSEFKEWANNKGYDIYENVLIHPEHYALSNADDEIKKKVPEFYQYTDLPCDIEQRHRFIEVTNILDNNRGCKIKDYLPEVAEIYGFN